MNRAADRRVRGWLHALAALALLLAFAAPARAQTYSSDSSAATQAAFPWIDISATGTVVALSDDRVSSSLAIGFGFAFGGTTYTTVQVSSNGMLHFAGQTTAVYTNSALPFTGSSNEPDIDTTMSALWDDLHPNGGNYIRMQTVGTAPNRMLVVSWLAVPYYCWTPGSNNCNSSHQTLTTTATFQIQISEQGWFVYRYGAVDGAGGSHTTTAAYSNPAGATIGWELTDKDYSQFSYHTASVPANTTILYYRPGAAPGAFNAFDATTAAGSTTGTVHTKVAGNTFPLAVVALNAARTALAPTFLGTVKVELLDASNNTGTLNGTTQCRSTWSAVLQTTTASFAVSDLGRKTVTFTENNAWRDVRVRISYPATGTPSVVACATDNFAIRPAAFALATGAAAYASDGDWQTAGTARNLANANATGGVVHKAGRPFTLRANAVNAQATPAITTNYNGYSPVATPSACAGTGCTATVGTLVATLTASNGAMSTTGATYSEAGSFALQLVDSSFASVDGADGSSAAEIAIVSPVVTVGRFVPDHFDIVSLATPVLRTFDGAACTRSFTYVGQPFGYATAPRAQVLARNASGATTALYAGTLWPSALAVSQTYAPLAPAAPGLELDAVTGRPLGTSVAPLVSAGNGTATLTAAATDTLQFLRSATTPAAPFNASISLTWSVSDATEAAVTGNGTIATGTPLAFSNIAFDAGREFRWGLLKLASAYGSPLLPLALPFETQHWDGTRFVTNAGDHCTGLAGSSMTFAAWRQTLAACDVPIATTLVRVASGRAFLTLARPPAGHTGSTDVTAQLGTTATGQSCTSATPGTPVPAAMPWLRGKWNNVTTYTQDPSARAAFGPYRSPVIDVREVF